MHLYGGFRLMKCVTCELDFDYYDESKQCLHCWCISHNMPCECRDEEDSN